MIHGLMQIQLLIRNNARAVLDVILYSTNLGQRSAQNNLFSYIPIYLRLPVAIRKINFVGNQTGRFIGPLCLSELIDFIWNCSWLQKKNGK
jgi:hypothetical protein